MAYGLDDFCAALCAAVAAQGIAGLGKVEGALSQLLRDREFVAATFDESMPPGSRTLAFEPVSGAYVLAHVHAPGREGSPHSHGESWAVYGTARGATMMTEWERVDDGIADGTALTAVARYTLEPGQTHAYHSGMLHSTAHPVPTWVIRVTGTNLDTVQRYRFDRTRDRIVPAVVERS